MLFVYSGPHDVVDIPALGLVDLRRGVEFEATGDDAQALLEQPENFTRTDKKEK